MNFFNDTLKSLNTKRRCANLVQAALQGEIDAIKILKTNFPDATIMGEGINVPVSKLEYKSFKINKK